MPPPNLTPATALDLTNTLPRSISLNVQGAPTGTGFPNSLSPLGEFQEVWFKFRAINPAILALALNYTADPSSSSYEPTIQWWTGPNSGPNSGNMMLLAATQSNWPGSGGPVYTQLGMGLGFVYYLQVINNNNAGVNSILNLSISANDKLGFSPGAIALFVTNPNTVTMIFDPATGKPLWELGNPLTFFLAQVANGTILFAVMNPSPFRIQGWQLYAGPFAPGLVVTSILPSPALLAPVATDGTLFYVVGRTGAAGSVVHTINQAGVVGGTSWTLPDPSSRNIASMGVNTAATLLYWTENAGGTGLHVFDLIGNTALSDLVAGVSLRSWGNDIVFDAAGNLVVIIDTAPNTSPPVPWVARRYSPAGTLLNTYALGSSVASNAPRMAMALDGLSIWVNIEISPAPTFGTFQITNYRLSDGVVLHQWTVVKKESDNLQFAQRFGPGESAPLDPLPVGMPGPVASSCANCWNEDGDLEVN